MNASARLCILHTFRTARKEQRHPCQQRFSTDLRVRFQLQTSHELHILNDLLPLRTAAVFEDQLAFAAVLPSPSPCSGSPLTHSVPAGLTTPPMMNGAGGRGPTLSRLAVVLFILVGVYILWDNWLPRTSVYDFKTHKLTHIVPHVGDERNNGENGGNGNTLQSNTTSPNPSDPPASFSEACRTMPGAENIMLLLKTGATELYQKLPTHFLTTFTCVQHFQIYSDLAQQFGDVEVHDAIAPVSWVFRDHHWDFELYRKLQHYHAEGQDLGHLGGDKGWDLDKWKFLPMLHHAFENAGEGIEWFVVIEADTALAWGNLLRWLKTMDPSKPYYLGAQNVIGTTTFAHGGSGFVISRKAADMLEEVRYAKGKQAFDEDWEEALSTACCGDEVIARTLDEAGVRLTPSWPIIQGETVASIDWTERHWCRPAISWHHVTPIEIDALWQFQAKWVDEHGWDEPFLHRDVFEHFIERHTAVNRTAWDNRSGDIHLVSAEHATESNKPWAEMEAYEQAATESQDGCAEACIRKGEGKGDCIQWMFSPGRCYLGRDIRFGRSDERNNVEERWVSGWVGERIEKFKKRFEGCDTIWRGVGAPDEFTYEED